MKHVYALLSLLLLSAAGQAQLITKFTWDNVTDVKTADYGPNATSISVYAISMAGGAGGTNGLSGGASGSHDINMYLPASYYEVPSLDISVDFKKKESDAVFFTLGTFDFGMNGGALHAYFLLRKNGIDTTIKLNNLYTLPDDNSFHTYHFVYAATTGIATISVDGTTVASLSEPASSVLSWTNSSASALVGKIMDGTGANTPILDNLIIKNTDGYVVLPLSLLSFDAEKTGNANQLTWTTTHEDNFKSFSVQRSKDGVNYDVIGEVAAGQRGYAAINAYTYVDNAPAATSYYRLKMTDIDGTATYSSVKKLSNTANTASASISVYPNPVVSAVNIRLGSEAGDWGYTVLTIDGKTLQAGTIAGMQTILDLGNAPKGLLVIRLRKGQEEAQTFKVFKQ